jgi:hypothetical protein
MRWQTSLYLGWVFLAASLAAAGETTSVARAQLRQAFPEIQFLTVGRGFTQLYGTAFGYGLSVEQTADNFVRTYADVFGVRPDELLPGSAAGDLYTLPLLYDEQIDAYAATVVYYRQYRDGLPVYKADLRLLVGNKPGYPLTLANATLCDLGDWHVTAGAAGPQEGAAHAAAAAFAPGLINFGPAELMVWPDPDGKPRTPHVALVFTADNGQPATPYYSRYEFVADAVTGEILHAEDLILHTDVTGSVHGMATTIPKADICNPEVDTPMPYAQVAIGSTSVYADSAGNFTIPNGGSSPVTVTSEMTGQYFTVNDLAGPLETLSLDVTPPGPADFMHNATNDPNDSEYVRAQVNAYVQANVVRDWALVQNPAYPEIPSQTGFPVNVNINDTCNAYYDGSSINFYRSGGGCPNTAFSNVIHHEYGHHLVAVGGSGQAAYGEGMADSIALCIADDPIEGYGFEGDCNAGIRDANNTMQYACSGEIHYCGQLLSGCVWSTRNELAATNPETYLSIISKLTLNSIPLHGPTGSITPAIYSDFIALDDMYYAGAHYAEITNGFAAHSMIPPPPPENDLCANALVACPGQTYTGNTGGADADGTTTCGTSDGTPDAWYTYTPATSGSAHLTMCAGTNYDAVLSVHAGCPGTASNTLICNDDACGQPYSAPSEVTLEVTAGNTYIIRISGWQGAAGVYGLTIEGPACQPVNYTLTTTVTPAEAGSITLDPPGGSYPPGTVVTLTAQPAAGWHFDSWAGDLAGSTNPTMITMGNDHSVTAVFGLLGDMNCAGGLDFGDINPFVLAITDPAAYQTAYPNCFILHGDFDGSGSVDFGDINPFVAALTQ